MHLVGSHLNSGISPFLSIYDAKSGVWNYVPKKARNFSTFLEDPFSLSNKVGLVAKNSLEDCLYMQRVFKELSFWL